MGVKMFDSLAPLLNSYNAQQKLINISEMNIAASANDPNYIALDNNLREDIFNDIFLGVRETKVTQRVNESLFASIRSKNSNIKGLESLDEFYEKIVNLFGDKDNPLTPTFSGKEMINAMNLYKSRKSAATAQETMDKISSHVQNITNLSYNLQNLRIDSQNEINKIAENINNTLVNISALNSKIKKSYNDYKINSDDLSVFGYVNERRIELNTLASFIKIDEKSFNPDNFETCHIFDENGNELIKDDLAASLLVQSTSIDNDNTSGNSIFLVRIAGDQVDITSNLMNSNNDGRLKELLNLRDTIIPGIQQQLDSYAVVMRDSFNAIHNAGVAVNALTSMTGISAVPDGTGTSSTGVLPLSETLALSGSGSVRIGSANISDGTLTSFVDIDLSKITNLSDIINAINNGTIGVTAALTAKNQLQLTATASGTGIVIGTSQGASTPLLSGSGTFNASTAYGFSHFFGLNNLFDTGTNTLGGSVYNASQSLSVRQAVLSSPFSLSTGTLDSTLSTGDVVLSRGDMSNLNQLSLALSQITTFAATSLVTSSTTTLESYSTSLFAKQVTAGKLTKSQLESQKIIYDGLSARAKQISGVDQKFEVEKMYEISIQMRYTIAAMTIMRESKNMILEY